MSKSKSKSIDLPTLPPEIEMLADVATFSGSTILALASRMMLAKHTHKLYGHLPDVLNGDDPHAVHQMRVATRRLRASLQSTAIAYKSKPVDALGKQLRRLARALGAVRDLDVLLLRLREDVQYLDSDRAEVEQRIEQFQAARDAAHSKLVGELLSKRTVRLLNKLNDFLLCPLDEIQADDGGLPLLVRHHAGSAIWHEFEAVQRFETVMPQASSEQLHDLRIGCKHLRYTLELFEPALGRDAREIIKQVETIQEHLGHIHDADVALAYFGVDDHSDQEREPEQPDESADDHETIDQILGESYGSAGDGLAPKPAAPESDDQDQILSSPRPRYALTRQVERVQLLDEFAPMWQLLNTRETRRKLGKLIAKL